MRSDKKGLQVDNNDSMGRELFCWLSEEDWKAQQNFEKDKSSSKDYTIRQLKLFRNNTSLRVLHVLLGDCQDGTKGDGAKELMDG